jgi:phospholipase/carboxylesterase
MILSRRGFTRLTGSALASVVLAPGCSAESFVAPGHARLTARPKPGVKTTARGRTPLDLGGERDGVLQLPSAIPASPLPLLVLLHGAGGRGENMLNRLGEVPDKAGVAVLSVDSRGPTWDGIRRGFGPDVAFIDRALNHVFSRVAVDPERLAIGGFSDGASYGLSLGLPNGDLFRKIVAFSPGFMLDESPRGKPRIFVSHGTQDEILPIARCSRILVPQLKSLGYEVTYREFEGGHSVPPAIAADGLAWLAAAR